MALTNTRLSVLGIINEVQRRLGVNVTSSLTETKHATMLLTLLNDVIDDVSDLGDWQEMFRETLVTAQSSVGTYELSVSADVQRVYEIVWNNQVAPLDVRDIQDMRRLQRISSYGVPRQFAIIGVSANNPKFRVYPVPTTAATFDVAYYKKTRMFTAVTADASAMPAFPARVLVAGLYAKSLLEENGGESTRQFQAAYVEYTKMKKEALNRFTSDTGTDLYFIPTGGRY